MNTIILYATKYGFTKEIAEKTAEFYPDAVICDLKSQTIPELSGFDNVIIGSSLYAGMIRKEAKKYMEDNSKILRNKKLGLFLCGLQSKNSADYFTNNFSSDILNSAFAKAFLGGGFDPKKAGFFDRFIIKTIAKITTYQKNIDEKNLLYFIDMMSEKHTKE